MKKYYIAFAICAALVACGKDEEVEYDPQVTLELSSKQAIFAEDGGQKTVFVTSNTDNWDYFCEQAWLSIVNDDHRMVLSADVNPDAASRTAIITVTAGSGENKARARYKVLQAGNDVVNLSEEATANCYIAPTSGSYKFDASVKGNGAGDGYSKYIETYGLSIDDVAYASLLWEATYDGDRTRSAGIIDGEPVYSSDDMTVYFNTGNIEGNASIGVYNAEGDILWSWHIWVSDKEVTVNYANGVEWMDRNLGALNNTPGDISNRGMLYQWGRKDPFLPSKAAYMKFPQHDYVSGLETDAESDIIDAAIDSLTPLANIHNTQVGDGCLKWKYYDAELADVKFTAPGNIDFAVKHPSEFIRCQEGPLMYYIFDWYLMLDKFDYSGDDERIWMQSHSNLWGEAEVETSTGTATSPATGYKSIFDPCPPGYVVPTQGSYGTVTVNNFLCYLNYDGSTISNETWMQTDYGYVWVGGSGDYFPASGMLSVYGTMGYTSREVNYWTAKQLDNSHYGKACGLFSADGYLYYGADYIGNALYDIYSFGARGWAAPIRCVKE